MRWLDRNAELVAIGLVGVYFVTCCLVGAGLVVLP
jgi:hypothetical protein